MLEEQQAAQRAEWEVRDLGAEAGKNSRMAAAYLPSDLI